MHREQRAQFFFLAFVALALALLFCINFPYGINEDPDGYLILQRALVFPAQGYFPSRTWGYPLYELFAYPLIVHFGSGSAKFYSLFWSLLGAIAFFKTLFLLTNNFSRAAFGTLCFLFHPLTITSSNLVMETSQAMALGLSALFFWARFGNNPGKKFNLYLIFVFCGLATATRLEYSLLTLALALSLLFFHSFTKKQILLSLLIYLVLALSPYLLLYDLNKMDPFPFSPIFDQSYLRKGARALIEMAALLGIPAMVYLLFFSRKIFQKPLFQKTEFPVVFFASLVFYILFFLQEPIKLEYIYILIPLLIVFAALHFRNPISLAVLCATFALPNLFQIHFFTREAGKIKMEIGFSPGAIAQDRNHRLRNEYHITGMSDILAQAAKKFGCDHFIRGLPSMPAPIAANPGQCYIVAQDKLRFWNADRLPHGEADREKLFGHSKVIIYPMEENKGWRQFFKFNHWKSPNLEDFRPADHSWGRSPNN